MPTGAAAAEAGRKGTPRGNDNRKDRGPGSVAGNMAADPDLNFTPNGRAVTSFDVACSERVKDEQTGEWRDGDTTWYRVTAWGNLAQNAAEHLQRGDRIVAEGRWVEEAYEHEGAERTRVVLVARDLGPSMMFRGARPERKQKDGE